MNPIFSISFNSSYTQDFTSRLVPRQFIDHIQSANFKYNRLYPVHHLKIIQPYFSLVASGVKDFELRKNDRNYSLHDVLFLWEYNSCTSSYTGNVIVRSVKYVFIDHSFSILPDEYLILGLRSPVDLVLSCDADKVTFQHKELTLS